MKISTDVNYDRPVTQRVKLGGTPRDRFDHDPKPSDAFVSCSAGQCANLPQEVWRDLPVLDAQGKAQMETVHQHIEASPASPVLRFLGVGAISGFIGATLGLMGGILTGHPGAGLALGAGLLGTGGGLLGAASAHGDQVRLDWNEHNVENLTYQGYSEKVEPSNLHGESGYFHRFEPQLQSTVVGSYKTPEVVHYQEKK